MKKNLSYLSLLWLLISPLGSMETSIRLHATDSTFYSSRLGLAITVPSGYTPLSTNMSDQLIRDTWNITRHHVQLSEKFTYISENEDGEILVHKDLKRVIWILQLPALMEMSDSFVDELRELAIAEMMNDDRVIEAEITDANYIKKEAHEIIYLKTSCSRSDHSTPFKLVQVFVNLKDRPTLLINIYDNEIDWLEFITQIKTTAN